MHRFFVPPEACSGPQIRLTERDSHHATRVLRLTAGEAIEVLDGAGGLFECRVRSADRRALMADVLGIRRQPAPPPVALAPALLKGRAMDWLLQKATELGAIRITPLLARRTVVRLADAEIPARVEDWRWTAIEAAKQCGNAWLPRLDPPRTVDDYLALGEGGRLLAAVLDPGAAPPGEVLARESEAWPKVTLVIGPEGDFTPEELGALRTAGAVPVTLGPRVLRAETAALAGLAILQHELARRPGPV